MIKLNIHDAKTHLSRYLENLTEGETILLCKRNLPIAEIRPLAVRKKKKRPLGLDKGLLKIQKAFFEPLPEEILSAFEQDHKS